MLGPADPDVIVVGHDSSGRLDDGSRPLLSRAQRVR